MSIEKSTDEQISVSTEKEVMTLPASSLYLEEYETSHKIFTPTGKHQLAELIARIGNQDAAAENLFAEAIQPWIIKIRTRIEEQIFSSIKLHDEHVLEDAVTDTLLHALSSLQKGKITDWHDFSTRFHLDLRNRYEVLKRRQLRSGLPKRVIVVPPHELDLLSEKSVDTLEQQELQEALDTVPIIAKQLSPLAHEFLLRNAAGENIESMVGDAHIKPKTLYFRVAAARTKLAKHFRDTPGPIGEWLKASENPLEVLQRENANQRETEKEHQQQEINRCVFQEMKTDIRAQKILLWKIVKNKDGKVDYISIAKNLALPVSHVCELTDFDAINLHTLQTALEAGSPERIKTGFEILKISKDHTVAFDTAVAELRSLLMQFHQNGGRITMTPRLEDQSEES